MAFQVLPEESTFTQLVRPMNLWAGSLKEKLVREYQMAMTKGTMIPMVMMREGATIR